MADKHVVSALVEKRRELSGLIADYEIKIRRLRVELAHVDATLKMFAPEYRVHAVRPKAPSPRRNGYFVDGEMGARVREGLRLAKGEPVSVSDILLPAFKDKGMDPNDRQLWRNMMTRFIGVLYRMHQEEKVEKIGHGLGARWRLPRVEPLA